MTTARRQGMTLMEVVVALAIAGTALAAGAAALGFLVDQHSRPGIQDVAAASAVRTTLRDWTSHARLTTEGDAEFRGTPVRRALNAFPIATHDSADAELTFVTTAPTDVAMAGTQVRIHMQRDSGGVHGLVAELTPFRARGAPVTITLAPDATGFQSRYLGSLFGNRVWQNSWISTSVLPVAIELRVLFDPATADPASAAAHALIAVPMTIPLGALR
ncbi:MAG: prepilin-type N-terminal cleavage/methylation domain-containing protein [bacterium]